MIREGDGRFSDPDTSQEQSQNADNNLNEFRAEIANAAKNGGVSLSTLSTDKGIENTTAGQPNGPALRIGESHAGQPEVALEFLDSGPGFDPATVSSLLDPFFTTKEGGTGLGLPIVQSIIVGHGGRIELENGDRGGALVRVILPATTTGETRHE